MLGAEVASREGLTTHGGVREGRAHLEEGGAARGPCSFPDGLFLSGTRAGRRKKNVSNGISRRVLPFSEMGGNQDPVGGLGHQGWSFPVRADAGSEAQEPPALGF